MQDVIIPERVQICYLERHIKATCLPNREITYARTFSKDLSSYQKCEILLTKKLEVGGHDTV